MVPRSLGWWPTMAIAEGKITLSSSFLGRDGLMTGRERSRSSALAPTPLFNLQWMQLMQSRRYWARDFHELLCVKGPRLIELCIMDKKSKVKNCNIQGKQEAAENVSVKTMGHQGIGCCWLDQALYPFVVLIWPHQKIPWLFDKLSNGEWIMCYILHIFSSHHRVSDKHTLGTLDETTWGDIDWKHLVSLPHIP